LEAGLRVALAFVLAVHALMHLTFRHGLRYDAASTRDPDLAFD
jgi:hypothetical protein